MKSFRSQFARPTGLLGSLAGHFMAVKNAERGRWVIAELGLERGHSVLEIGFGSGADLRRVAALVEGGRVAGIDPSAPMLRQARWRNRRNGADLREGTAGAIPFDDASFDRVFAINTVQFWDDLSVGLADIARVLRPRGIAGIAIQPRNKGATLADTTAWGDRIERAMRDVGFATVRRVTNEATRPPTVCVLGSKN